MKMKCVGESDNIINISQVKLTFHTAWGDGDRGYGCEGKDECVKNCLEGVKNRNKEKRELIK